MTKNNITQTVAKLNNNLSTINLMTDLELKYLNLTLTFQITSLYLITSKIKEKGQS